MHCNINLRFHSFKSIKTEWTIIVQLTSKLIGRSLSNVKKNTLFRLVDAFNLVFFSLFHDEMKREIHAMHSNRINTK